MAIWQGPLPPTRFRRSHWSPQPLQGPHEQSHNAACGWRDADKVKFLSGPSRKYLSPAPGFLLVRFAGNRSRCHHFVDRSEGRLSGGPSCPEGSGRCPVLGSLPPAGSMAHRAAESGSVGDKEKDVSQPHCPAAARGQGTRKAAEGPGEVICLWAAGLGQDRPEEEKGENRLWVCSEMVLFSPLCMTEERNEVSLPRQARKTRPHTWGTGTSEKPAAERGQVTSKGSGDGSCQVFADGMSQGGAGSALGSTLRVCPSPLMTDIGVSPAPLPLPSRAS